MGVVYRARQNSLGRLVALKMLAGGALASEAEIRRIHDEAMIAARLEHPNIVPIYEVGVHEEIAYYTMPLMEGGSLAEQMSGFHGRFGEVARLLETISRAVHHGHQRGILHRDLKPANVLLDAAGVPYVADFGLAKALDSEARVTQTGSVEGTLSYMPLEQAQPGGLPLTVAVDVYSLGVILYELLTCRLPFEADSFDALLARLREGRPLAPRAIHPRIPRSLEAICLKCLEKEPARRYGSAAELADDLGRFLENRPVLAVPAGPLERGWMWCLRHPLGAVLLATLLWAISVAAVGTFRAERELRDAALRTNVHFAPLIADLVHRILKEHGLVVEEMAKNPRLIAALQARDEEALDSFCKENLKPRGGPGASGSGAPFNRVFVEDTSGITLARWPSPQPPDLDFRGKEYSWRDYFQGAQRRTSTKSREAYISRAYVSESHNRLTFAISAPRVQRGWEVARGTVDGGRMRIHAGITAAPLAGHFESHRHARGPH
jgi:serine/threonine-protein kinase